MTTSTNKPGNLNLPAAYNLWSENYDQFDNPMLAMVDYTLWREPFDVSGKRVLELGCGTGRNVPRLMAAGASSYLGLDQSNGMLEKARLSNPNTEFMSADIQARLPIVSPVFDFVLATLVFEHLPDLKATLTEAFRVLAPQGSLRILEIHSDLWQRGTKAHFQHQDQEIELSSFCHDANEWNKTLHEIGFSNISIKSLYASTEAIQRCDKLAKHKGQKVLFDIHAKKEQITK